MRIEWIGVAIIGAGLAAAPAIAQGVPTTLNGGDPVAAEADRMAAHDVGALLRQADQAARQGRLPLASELVERAEALTLTRSTLAGTEGMPVREGLVATLAEARAALGRRDVPAATALIARASGMQAQP
ncbi:hypothetical protein [Roseomonas rosulenta]|uniref:hypothetical protein n=1 Tax=Roseomonas rosulenta TaxID=2748667 RepID=UPI0018E04C40|nr:hypothetical protein [Roseomonas rosulenta]